MNVWKTIETSAECTQDHSAKNLGQLTEMWWVKVLRCHHLYSFLDIPKSLEIYNEIF